jgi:sugar phosphate isomerase/epimerase
MGAGIEHEFNVMKSRIRSTHVHDNNGKDDSHLFPFADGGTIDWQKSMPLLRSCDEKVALLLELREMPDLQHPIDETARVFEKLENL